MQKFTANNYIMGCPFLYDFIEKTTY
jgi:hypothetical protein